MEVTDEEEGQEIWESSEPHLDAVEPRGKTPTPLDCDSGEGVVVVAKCRE